MITIDRETLGLLLTIGAVAWIMFGVWLLRTIQNLMARIDVLQMRLRHIERQQGYEAIERGPGCVEFRSIWGEEAE